jgi:hypothetical protein
MYAYVDVESLARNLAAALRVAVALADAVEDHALLVETALYSLEPSVSPHFSPSGSAQVGMQMLPQA